MNKVRIVGNKAAIVSLVCIATVATIAGCGIHLVHIPVSDTVVQTTDAVPLKTHLKLLGGSYDFGKYHAERKNGWTHASSWRVFAVGKDKFKSPFQLTEHGNDGKEWVGQCAYSYSAIGIGANAQLFPKEGLICEFMEQGASEPAGTLDIHESHDGLALTYQGTLHFGQTVALNLESIHHGASGGFGTSHPLGFRILKGGEEIGAVQIIYPRTLWLPKTGEERLAIALAAPILATYEQPREQNRKLRELEPQ